MKKLLLLVFLFVSLFSANNTHAVFGSDLTSSLLNKISDEVNYADSIARTTNSSGSPLYQRFHQGITSPPGTLPSFSVGQAFYAADYNNIISKLMTITRTINDMATVNQTTKVTSNSYSSKSNGQVVDATLYSTMYYQALELRSAIDSVKNTMCGSDSYRPSAGSCKNVTEFGKFSYASDNRIMGCTNGSTTGNFYRTSRGYGSPSGCTWECNTYYDKIWGNTACATYSRYTSGFGTCYGANGTCNCSSCQCGGSSCGCTPNTGGIQYQTVYCKQQYTGAVASDSKCSHLGPKPPTSQSCTKGCPSCSSSCKVCPPPPPTGGGAGSPSDHGVGREGN